MAEQMMVESRPSESQSEVGTTTISEESAEQAVAPPTLRLVLRKPKNPKKVNWTTETVDNEHMNKRKSKCCCIYRKPHVFGESSSESEDECDNCYGHCELRKPLLNDNNNPSPPPPPPSVPPVA